MRRKQNKSIQQTYFPGLEAFNKVVVNYIGLDITSARMQSIRKLRQDGNMLNLFYDDLKILFPHWFKREISSVYDMCKWVIGRLAYHDTKSGKKPSEFRIVQIHYNPHKRAAIRKRNVGLMCSIHPEKKAKIGGYCSTCYGRVYTLKSRGLLERKDIQDRLEEILKMPMMTHQGQRNPFLRNLERGIKPCKKQ